MDRASKLTKEELFLKDIKRHSEVFKNNLKFNMKSAVSGRFIQEIFKNEKY